MEVRLTADQEAFIRQALASGRFRSADEAIQEALSLWEARERRRAELLASLDEAESSLQNGKGYPITEQSMQELSEDVKRRGRARLTSEQHTSR